MKDSPKTRSISELRIGLAIHGISQGGAERILTCMANYWVQKGSEVILFTQDSGEDEDAYYIESNVVRVNLNVKSNSASIVTAARKNLQRLSKLRSSLRTHRPDVVIAFLPEVNILAVLAARVERIPVIISERNNPKHDPLPVPWKILRLIVYPLSNRLVVQTKRIRDMYSSLLGTKCVVIPNFVRAMKTSAVVSESKSQHIIIAVGRLFPSKAFDVLIDSFASIMGGFPSWDLEIWGTGSEEKVLREQIVSKGATARIRLMGTSPRIEEKMISSDIFVLSSRYEGFPNALCEAMACGLPVISTDCVSGPREIIDNEVNGLLVPVDDIQSLASALSRLINDGPLRARIAQKAKDVREVYSIDRIMNTWEKLILDCI